jgi:hypothetical protein
MTLALDGSAISNAQSTTTISATITTSLSPDVIYAVVAHTTAYSASSTVTGGGLNWTLRAHENQGTPSQFTIETWYAVASASLSSAVITATIAASGNAEMVVFGVSGANTASIFDTNSAVPATQKLNLVSPGTITPGGTVSTNNPSDFLIAALAVQGKAGNAITVPSGFTQIQVAVGAVTPNIAVAYQIVSSTLTNVAVDATFSGTFSGTIETVTIDDAIQAASGGVASGAGTEQGVASAVGSGLGVGEGRFAALTVASPKSQHVVGEGTFGGSVSASAANPKMINLTGGFRAGITVFSYVGGGLYPITGRQEEGGTTAPTLQLDSNVFAFDINILTSPYASEPPPDGGSVQAQ